MKITISIGIAYYCRIILDMRALNAIMRKAICVFINVNHNDSAQIFVKREVYSHDTDKTVLIFCRSYKYDLCLITVSDYRINYP